MSIPGSAGVTRPFASFFSGVPAARVSSLVSRSIMATRSASRSHLCRAHSARTAPLITPAPAARVNGPASGATAAASTFASSVSGAGPKSDDSEPAFCPLDRSGAFVLARDACPPSAPIGPPTMQPPAKSPSVSRVRSRAADVPSPMFSPTFWPTFSAVSCTPSRRIVAQFEPSPRNVVLFARLIY